PPRPPGGGARARRRGGRLAGRRPGAPRVLRRADGWQRHSMSLRKNIRVAVIADYLEEGWPSMDLVADMLMEHLRKEHAGTIEATLVRPPMPRRLSGRSQ